MSVRQTFAADTRLAGTGRALPKRVVTNASFEKTLDTSDDWIVRRTGIRERRFAEQEEAASLYAAAAGREALQASGVAPAEIGLLLLSTSTPDAVMPATANYVQRELGLANAFSYDVSAACSGFVFAMASAVAHLQCGLARRALVVSVELYSSILDFDDRNTAVLFGDGAGAAVLVQDNAGQDDLLSRSGVLAISLGTNLRHVDNLRCVGGGTAGRKAWRAAPVGSIAMDGRDVFKQAVIACETRIREILEDTGYSAGDISCVIPHQANTRIIEKVAENLNYPFERMAMNLDRYGNMASASIPVALDEFVRSGRVHKGDLVLLVSAGAGFSSGAILLRL